MSFDNEIAGRWSLRLVLALLFFCSPSAFCATVNAQAQVVAHLYRDFGWQAFASQQDLFGEGVAQQNREVLGRYFGGQLVDLLIKDAACQGRERGLCRLDFDVLFDSQDPVVSDLDVQTLAPGKVRVRYKNPVNSETTAIDFMVTQVAGQWKILDVLYGRKAARSLKEILQGR